MRKVRVPKPVSNKEDIEGRYWHIPMGLLEIVAVERLTGPFKLFLYLKKVSNGMISPRSHSFADAAKDLKISRRTVNRHLKKLIDRNWVGRFNSGVYIIRGFDKLRIMEGYPSRTAVTFDNKVDLPRTREFVQSACVAHLARKQRARLWRERLKEDKRGASHEISQTLPTHFEIAAGALVKIFGISTGTAFNWKKQGKRHGYLDIVHVLRPMNITNGAEWKRVNPEQAHLLIRRDNKYFLQYPDKVMSKMRFCRRRTLQKTDKN